MKAFKKDFGSSGPQLQAVFRSFPTASLADCEALLSSPLLCGLQAQGVSTSIALVGIAVFQADATNINSVPHIMKWLRSPVDSAEAWSLCSSTLCDCPPSDNSRFQLSHPEASTLRLPELQGGIWARNVFATLSCSAHDVGCRLLVWHPFDKRPVPAIVLTYEPSPSPNGCWGHQILFDNGDVRW